MHKGIGKNSEFDNQIIIAVNEGKDGTLDWLQQKKIIDYVHFDINMGVCFAVNSCRPYVDNDYIVYMNDDMYPAPNWDKNLFDHIQRIDNEKFFLSSTLIEPISNKNPNYVAVIHNFGKDVNSFDEEQFLKKFESLVIDDWRGASWPPNVIHKNTWDLIGGFSIEFTPGMYSDPDFSMKLWQAGVRTMYGVGNSLIYHFGEKSTGRVKKNKGSDTFLRKWGITARTYYSNWLEVGKPYEGSYSDNIELGSATKLRNKIKQIIRSF